MSKERSRQLGENPRGTSEGLPYENPLRDWISANRIRMRGWDSTDSLLESEPLLRTTPYKEAISGQIFSMKQEAPSESWGAIHPSAQSFRSCKHLHYFTIQNFPYTIYAQICQLEGQRRPRQDSP